MEIKKNDEFELEITDMGNDGEGIGRYGGMAFFVKGAITGDRIIAGATKVNKNYGFARIVRILEPSPNRCEPECSLAGRCGGCQLQHIDYAAQLEYKQKKVADDLQRIGGIDSDRIKSGKVLFYPIIGMDDPYHYRNKGQFPVGTGADRKVVSGFYAGHSHRIIDTDSCLLQHPVTDGIMAAIKEYICEAGVPAYDEETGAGIVRHVLTRVGYKTGEVMICVVINAEKLPKEEVLVEKLKKAILNYNSRINESALEYRLASVSININKRNTNVIMGEHCRLLYGNLYITDYIGDVKYRISPLSFYQVNPVQTRRLYSTALEFAELTGNETVWDLYCGIGTISLFLAQKAKQVYGVEIVPEAIEDARENARLNTIGNAEFFVGPAEEVLPAKYAADPSMRADVIVVDPPRKGCEEALLECITHLEPKRIVYVSCDPATLARDVKYLEQHGYILRKVRPCDMFPQSSHVETVCLLSKGDVKSQKLRVEFSLEDMDTDGFKKGATYNAIRDWIKEKYGYRVTNLNIAQVKQKYGIIERENYNKPKSPDSKQPGCPEEKVKAIEDAMRHFQMI